MDASARSGGHWHRRRGSHRRDPARQHVPPHPAAVEVGLRELTRTEAGLLTTLNDGPRRITELAETEALAQPSVSKLVDKLEGRGLVARGRAPDDGRAVVVSISADGRLCLEAARSHLRSVLRQILGELQDDDLVALTAAGEAVERLIEILQRRQGPI